MITLVPGQYYHAITKNMRCQKEEHIALNLIKFLVKMSTDMT